jgi:hypothetical protein
MRLTYAFYRVSISHIHLKLDQINLVSKTISQSPAGNPKNSEKEFSEIENKRINLARIDHSYAAEKGEDDTVVETSTEVLYGSVDLDSHSLAPQNERALQTIANADRISASRSDCPRWCSCLCHRQSRLNSPRLLNEIFGAMSIGYVGMPFFSNPCNEKQCKPRNPSSAQITYQFPSWMMSRAVSMLVSSKMSGPELQLRTLRIIPANSDVFRLAITGDVEGMKTMFKHGHASIYDIDNRRWSLLHVGVV